METEFKQYRASGLNKVEQELAEAKDKLADATSKIAQLQDARLSEAREAKMEELLSPLSGTAKEQMKIILQNVKTEKLDEAYKVYLGRVLKEAVAPKTQTAKSEQLTESEVQLAESRIVTGNDNVENVENVSQTEDDQLSRIRKLAGLV